MASARPYGIDIIGEPGPAEEQDVVLYDGFGIETEPDRSVPVGRCVHCGAPRELELRSLLLGPSWTDPGPDEIAPDALDRVVTQFGLDRFRFDGSTYLTDSNRLSIHAVVWTCPGCGRAVLQLVSYGEFQPARWMAITVGSIGIATP